MMRRKFKTLVAVMFFVFVAFNATSAFAASGSFVMDRRVVFGYENVQYTFSEPVVKTVKCNAAYDFSTRPNNTVADNRHNELHVTVYEQYQNWIGALKWQEYSGDYLCSFSGTRFTLNQSIALQPGTYGFLIYRPYDDIYVDADTSPIGYMRISGNVWFS